MLIPLLFLVVMVRDKYSKYILLYFGWGLVSVLFAFVFNEFFAAIPGQTYRVSSDIAPIVEETVKSLPLLLFLRSKNLNSRLLIYCAMASGIGFSVQETLYYFTSFTSSPDISVLFPVLVRTITTCLMHGMCTAAIGIGITITSEYKAIRVPMLLGLLALSATIHSLFNILINTRLAFISLIMPAILYFIGLAILSETNSNNEENTVETVLHRDTSL